MNLRIRQLSSEVANQIAAGEVIERPASVVKELLENSFDARATSIYIEIEFGGLTLIKVSDNGIGIHPEDLSLALAAHATSKIAQLSDLYTLHSMGFRGEALASIASISKLSICSKPESQTHAMLLQREGHEFSLSPYARSVGTTVEVRDLFYNAPVRKKFLKTVKIEFSAIENIVKRFALSAPHIELYLKHNGLQVLALPSASCNKMQLLRVKKLLGKLFVEEAIHLDVNLRPLTTLIGEGKVQEGTLMHEDSSTISKKQIAAEISLRGWISGLNYQRSQSDKLWVYINHRMVKDKLILQAVKQAYDGVLHPGRFPACVLYLSLPTQEVDINVHPTKHEVRFQQPRIVHDFIVSQVAGVLGASIPPSSRDKTYSQNESQSLLLRETYTPQPLVSISSQARGKSWIVLNPQVVLVFINHIPFLVDLEYLQKHYLRQVLSQKPLPLLSRPVLVPMTFVLHKENKLVERYQHPLAQLGLILNLMSETTVMVRNLPVDLPYLNLSLMLEKLHHHKEPLDHFSLLELLIDCHISDAQQVSIDQQEELCSYLQHLMTSKEQISWCLRLDHARCRELLHV